MSADPSQHPDEPLLPLLTVGQRMDKLRQALCEELNGHEDAAVRELASRLVEIRPEDAINIVLVGQHDAGKSLLVRGLTGREDIAVGAGPLTDSSTAYEWHGHRLVDTPGVAAGVREEHDRIADEALKVADVALFVLTVEGLDDLIHRYFLRVLDQLRSPRPLVIVVNKSGSERNERAVTEADLARTIGPMYDRVPVVWTDAKRWAQADRSSDPREARRSSGLPELAEVITDLVTTAGSTVRLMQPLRAWSDSAQAALRLLSRAASGTGSDLSQVDAAAEQIDSQHDARCRAITRRSDEAVDTLTAGLRSAGPDVDESTLTRLVQRAADVFDERLLEDNVHLDETLSGEVARRADAEVDAPVLDIKSLVQRSLVQLAQSFSGAGARPGGVGHQAVTKLWHSLGGKFRPWGAVKAASRIGRYAGRANVALTVGTAGWELYTLHRDAQRRAEIAGRVVRWHDEAHEHAKTIVQEWREAAALTAQELHQVRADEVARQRLTVLIKLTQSDERARHLVELDGRCHTLIRSLG